MELFLFSLAKVQPFFSVQLFSHNFYYDPSGCFDLDFELVSGYIFVKLKICSNSEVHVIFFFMIDIFTFTRACAYLILCIYTYTQTQACIHR
jgi:hypothetical protein